jgi:hypothetical protein
MALQRPLKEGSVRTYQEKVGLGFTDILASEVDADVDTIYAAWNGTLGGDLTGTLPNPTVAAAAKSKWTVSGATLTPTDATKTVAAQATSGDSLQFGTRTVKGRLRAAATADVISFSVNRNEAGAADDGAQSAWRLRLRPTSAADDAAFVRAPAGGGAEVALLTLDGNGKLTVAANGDPLVVMGAGTVKGTLSTIAAGDTTLNVNHPWQPQDVSKAGWSFQLNSVTDNVLIYRKAPGAAAGTVTNTFLLDNAGNLTIYGPVGMKSTGTTWANPSDIRLKRDVTPYTHGLADILQLEPISYTLISTEMETCGLDAAKVQTVFPECVGTTRMKLQPEDEEETEVLTLDIHPILIALINAVQELAGRVSPVPQPT